MVSYPLGNLRTLLKARAMRLASCLRLYLPPQVPRPHAVPPSLQHRNKVNDNRNQGWSKAATIQPYAGPHWCSGSMVRKPAFGRAPACRPLSHDRVLLPLHAAHSLAKLRKIQWAKKFSAYRIHHTKWAPQRRSDAGRFHKPFLFERRKLPCRTSLFRFFKRLCGFCWFAMSVPEPSVPPAEAVLTADEQAAIVDEETLDESPSEVTAGAVEANENDAVEAVA